MPQHARIKKVLPGGCPFLTTLCFCFFCVCVCGGGGVLWGFYGREDALKTGHYLPASETAFRWCADDGPILNAGLVALRILTISGDPDPLSPFWIRACTDIRPTVRKRHKTPTATIQFEHSSRLPLPRQDIAYLRDTKTHNTKQ